MHIKASAFFHVRTYSVIEKQQVLQTERKSDLSAVLLFAVHAAVGLRLLISQVEHIR